MGAGGGILFDCDPKYHQIIKSASKKLKFGYHLSSLQTEALLLIKEINKCKMNWASMYGNICKSDLEDVLITF